jgi:hypothetical protein
MTARRRHLLPLAQAEGRGLILSVERVGLMRHRLCDLDVGLRKVVALEQQRFAGCFGKGIGKAIAKIQSSFVAPLAEIVESLSRQLAMLNRDGFHDDAGPSEEGFGLAHAVGAKLALDDHRQFNIIGDADLRAFCCTDTLDEIYRFSFPV